METNPDSHGTALEKSHFEHPETIPHIIFRMVILLGIATLCALGIIIPIKILPDALATVGAVLNPVISNTSKEPASSMPQYSFLFSGSSTPSSSYIFVYTPKDGLRSVSGGNGPIQTNTQTFKTPNGKTFLKTTIVQEIQN